MVKVTDDLDLGDVDARLPPFSIVRDVREKLWASGYRAVPLYNFNHTSIPKNDRGKRPAGHGWQKRARRDPPEAVTAPIDARIRNTGALADGFRFVDSDINDIDLGKRVENIIREKVGETVARRRSNSGGRTLLPYRAAEGMPTKRSISGKKGKIEVLGFGQQAVIAGVHETGTQIYWEPKPLWEVPANELPVLTEEQITELFQELAPIIEAGEWRPVKPGEVFEPGRHFQTNLTTGETEVFEPSGETAAGADPNDTASEPLPPLGDVHYALAYIPNSGPKNWEWWNSVGLCIWHCTQGSEEGFNAFVSWSAKNPCYTRSECEERWSHYAKSPPSRTGYSKLCSMASKANGGFVSPSELVKQRAGTAPGASPADEDDLPLLTLEDVMAMPPPNWLIKDVLVENSFSVIYGPPKSLKSFIVLDFAMHLATGLPWRGAPVKQCPITYVCAEGVQALGRRISAWMDAYDVETLPTNFRVVPMAINIATEKGVKRLINRIKKEADFNPGLVIIDTLAKCSTGVDENSAKDMGVIVDHGAYIQRELDTALLLVHHCGKDAAKGLRGSSALFGAIDTLLQVIRDGLRVSLLVESHKDAEDGFALKFQASPVELATRDEFGRVQTSLALHPVEGGEAIAPATDLDIAGPAERALGILKEMMTRPEAAFRLDSPGDRCVLANAWRDECCRRGVMATRKPGTDDRLFQRAQQAAFRRARAALHKNGLIEDKEELVWPT